MAKLTTKAEKLGNIRDGIARALDSQGYESIEQLVSDCILQTRDAQQMARCPKCHAKFTVVVKQPAPDKRAKALEILANQALGAPGRAADKDKPPSMADGLRSMTNEQLAKLVGG